MKVLLDPREKIKVKADDVREFLEHLKLEKQYDNHETKCNETSKEINKWGKKTTVKLNFLKKKH